MRDEGQLRLARTVRELVLEFSYRANVGHIGSSLSVVDILAALFGEVLCATEPDDPERDRFLLSKGHAGLALYCTMAATGRLRRAELETFCTDGTLLGVHPDSALRGIDFSSGSLGQGLSVGTGAALAGRLDGSRRRIFVLMSDAECDEGAVWEAAMFAAHHRLGSLVALIDVNGQQAFGRTSDVIALDRLRDRWESFGWDAREVDGHDADELVSAIEETGSRPDMPHVLIANTVFGRGVSFMENSVDWHYLPMSEEQYEQAREEVSGRS